MSGFLISDSADVEIYFDGVLEERWSEPVNVTEHPIDRRAPVTDHIQALQRTLTLRAVVTATPNAQGVFAYEKVGPDRYLGVRDLLREYRGTIFRYLSNRTGEVERLVLRGMSYTVDPRERIIFNLAFVQVNFATAQQGKLPPVPKKKRDDVPTPSGSAGYSKFPTGAPLFESRTRALGDLLSKAFPF